MTTTDGDLQRFAAKITKAEFGRDRDRGHFTLCITLDFGGSGQCFVSPVLGALATRRDETGAGLDFLRRVLDLFKACSLDEVEGRYCYALKRSLTAPIQGLATLEPDGDRTFVVSDWQVFWFARLSPTTGEAR